jgi:hypothetical protein
MLSAYLTGQSIVRPSWESPSLGLLAKAVEHSLRILARGYCRFEFSALVQRLDTGFTHASLSHSDAGAESEDIRLGILIVSIRLSDLLLLGTGAGLLFGNHRVYPGWYGWSG